MTVASSSLGVAKRRDEDFDRYPVGKKLRFNSVRYEDFKPGALIKMRLVNFVTYKLTEFDLSPSLNMIIGPNGSGKSTFVCAVCLGLAGKTELLGRSKKVTDFIKNGEDSGLIEITLKNSGKLQDIPHVNAEDQIIKITRRITRLKTRTEYFINDREVTEHVVRALVAGLNIQLDNLCQFLSQERVASFAGLKSDKLLVETLRSIDLGLCEMLASLKTHQSEENDFQKQLNSKQKRLDELLKKRNELQGSVEQLRHYQEKRKRIDIHRKLIPYVRIKAVAAERRLRRAELNQAVRNLKEFLKEKSPLVELDSQIKEKVASAAEELKTTEELFEKLKAACTERAEKLCDIRSRIGRKKLNAESCQKRRSRLRAEIAHKRQELDQERAALRTGQMPDPALFSQLEARQNDLIRHESEIKRAIREAESNITNKNYEISDLKRRIITKEALLSKDDRIGVLDNLASTDRAGGNIFRTVKDAVGYVRDRPEMRLSVLEPPVIAVSVSSPKYAAYLAQCVDFNTRIAFTLVGSEAYDRFANELLDNFRVNTRELSAAEMKPPLPREQLKRLGFDFYLSDIVTGDARVIKMLCQNCNIHSIPISLRELAPQQITKLMEPRSNGKLLFTKFIHGYKVVDMGIGAYSRQVWTKDYECAKKTDFFQISVMSDEKKSSIRAEISQVQAKIDDISKSIEDLESAKKESRNNLSKSSKENERISRELQELNDIRKKWSLAGATIQRLTSEIEKLTDEIERGLPSQIKQIDDEISTIKTSQTTVLRELAATIKRLKECQKELALSNVRNFEAKNLDISMSDVIQSINRKEEELNNECNSRKKRLEEAKNVNVQELKKEIKSYTEETQQQLHAYVEKYDNEGTFNLEHIEGIIDKLESEVATLNNDESAISILDGVEKEVRDLEKDLPQIASKLKEVQGLIREKRKEFEPKVDDLVKKISDKFSELFKQIGSKGYVGLSKPTSFAEWKIEIKVAFRDSAELTRLDAQKQSGGERAVSTVLYMIALQPFTTAPFRVVDEINQGMDARNERIVHKFMVTNACVDNTSQYFLITPKLLTDLYYDERMMIHTVMAGPWVPNPSERPEMACLGKTSKYII
ncbi:hypothetical protein HG536_0F03650 [Torulaspora globosa]|uniref:Structural maintenance of chromosomes protein 5 n=1 Tax=Torulaspora globosa TaxID=48254 RepID=A0A7G3ZKK4_9SACH|nr:uncharacterized protein HG536_0F03650 [Torulaspora globosa]QLL34040.1 hypothetical protein HG536_0F03650 [Torulaspora globosa]